MEAKEIKKRIKREKPNKKWSEEEVKSILNYIQEAPEIEAPTAQIFYKKFIERSGIAATWELVRWKVRHLKTCFKKADDWRKSTGAGLLDSDAGTSSVEGKVLQMCPHYKQLNEIFGEKNVAGDFVVIDSGDVTIIDDSIVAELAEPILESSFVIDTVDIPYDVEEVINPSPPADSSDIRETYSPAQAAVITQGSSTSKKAKEFAEKLKKNAPKSSAAHLAIFQAERTEMFRIKLEWEKEKHEKELALSDRKLNLEEEKVKREIDLKVLELQKDERLKILQMEKDERIQKYEIEMKYKFQSKK